MPCVLPGARALLLAALACVPVSASARPAWSIREQKAVVVDGRRETWRLEWRRPPRPFCANPAFALGAACRGFAYGEEGELDLVRRVGRREIDRLALAPLFPSRGGEPPAAILRRWEPRPDDPERFGDGPRFSRELERRPAVPVLRLEDLDGDGAALEWVLQVEFVDSSIYPSIAITLDRRTGKLAPIRSVEEPAEPLTLWRPALWRALKSGGAVALRCGDHGQDWEDRLELSHDPAGWHARMSQRPCPAL